MLHIYISLRFTLVVREARPGPLPVPEKRFCGTYWLYSYDSGNEAVQNELCHTTLSLASERSKHSCRPLAHAKSVNNPHHRFDKPGSSHESEHRINEITVCFRRGSICQSSFSIRKEGNPHDMVSCRFIWLCCLDNFFGRPWRRQPWLSWHLRCDRAASPPPHDCWHWRSVSFHYNTHRLSRFR